MRLVLLVFILRVLLVACGRASPGTAVTVATATATPLSEQLQAGYAGP